MATLQVSKRPPKEGFGQKVKHIVEAVGTIKGLYDTGKTIYAAAQVAAPYIQAGIGML